MKPKEQQLIILNLTYKMKKPFIEINSDNFILNPTKVKPIEGYEFPINKDTLEEFPNCCAFHKKVYSNAVEWFKEFPNCCKFHKSMVKEWWYDKKRFSGVEKKISNQVSYTEYHLEQKIQSEDWYEDICDYIEYNVFSFGQPAIGLHVYLHSIRYVINNHLFKYGIKESQVIKLNEYLDTFYFESNESKEKNEKSNLNILHAQYQQWLKIFPFELSFFKSIQPHFQNQLPIGNGKPTFNKYTGMSSVKLHTQTTLFEYLLKVTDLLLTQVNTCVLYDKGKLKEPEKIKIELLLNERKLKLQKGYVSNASNQDTRYRKMLKEWFKDEKKFLKEITPLLKELPPQPIRTKAEILKEKLSEYGFFELEKIKLLAEQNQNIIVDKISSKGLPYAIAMFDFLEFIQYLEKNHFDTKYKLNIEVSKWFDKDKEGRAVKGNISSLLKNTTENKNRYTAYKHKETVVNDYKELK